MELHLVQKGGGLEFGCHSYRRDRRREDRRRRREDRNRFIEGVGSQRDDTEELELNVRVVRYWLGGQLLQFRVIGQGFLVFGGVTFVTCKVVNWFLWFQLINLYIYPNPD